MLKNTLGAKLLLMAACSMTFATMTSCKNSGAAPEEIASKIGELPSDNGGTSYFALVYGSSASDRTYLSNRVAGYQAPGLSDVFNQWKRFSGTRLFNSVSEIVQSPSYCFTGFDINYNWNPGMNGSTPIQPGTYGNCVNSNDFVSSSWSYIASPDRLYNASNGSYFNGFLSGIQFTTYNFQAVVSSTDRDDDGIGLVIAASVDATGAVHTLTAMRTQGGVQPALGWSILYKRDNTVVRSIGDISIGGVNTNGSQGDRNGWNGRKALIRVERSGDSITAYTSQWANAASSDASLAVDSASAITINLADAANSDLARFQGEQYYGYGTISQLGATFSSINFSTPNIQADPDYIYDLYEDKVYVKSASGGYTLVSGVSAISSIGYPKRIKNAETQKEYLVTGPGLFSEL